MNHYTLIFIQEGYIQEGQPQFGQKIKKFIYMMTSLLLNKGLRLNSVSNLLISIKKSVLQKESGYFCSSNYFIQPGLTCTKESQDCFCKVPAGLDDATGHQVKRVE